MVDMFAKWVIMKYTKHNLKKIQELLEELGYAVRYEKGHFQSGYCVVENKKIAIINKFYDTEGRIHVLLDIISKIGVNPNDLSENTAQFFKKIISSQEKQEE